MFGRIIVLAVLTSSMSPFYTSGKIALPMNTVAAIMIMLAVMNIRRNNMGIDFAGVTC